MTIIHGFLVIHHKIIVFSYYHLAESIIGAKTNKNFLFRSKHFQNIFDITPIVT